MSFCAPAARRTVFALSTGGGHPGAAGRQRAALAVVRVTGPQAHTAAAVLAGWNKCNNDNSSVDDRKSKQEVVGSGAVSAGNRAQETGLPGDSGNKFRRPFFPPARKLVRAALRCPSTGRTLDDALVALFPGPRSATGEDIAEFHIHGSPAVIAGVLGALGSLSTISDSDIDDSAFRQSNKTAREHHSDATALTARGRLGAEEMDIGPAPAGEFMRRAYLNGKMDLAAIEGVADLLAATTPVQASAALAQMRGALSQTCALYKTDLLRALAFVEAAIDFGEDEDVGDEVVDNAIDLLKPLLRRMQAQLDMGRRVGERLRDGFRCVIVGPPNVGKSSLLNCLLQRDAALVSPLPGTTRDVVEAPVDIGGFPVLLGDTAGVRHHDGTAGTLDVIASIDPVEKEGIRRALQRASDADIRICTFDVAELIEHGAKCASSAVWDILRDNPDVLVVLNKADCLPEKMISGTSIDVGRIIAAVPDTDAKALLEGRHRQGHVFAVSCASQQGIPSFLNGLENLLNRKVDHGSMNGDSEFDPDRFGGMVITRERHRHHLQQACEAVKYALESSSNVLLVAEGLRRAIRDVGMIAGAADVEDMLDVVFSEFCIGK